MNDRRRGSLTHRLVTAQIVVVFAMTLTTLVTAALVGPRVFDSHIREAHHAGGDVYAHATEAFRFAGAASLIAGLVIAGVGAVLAGMVVTRRIGHGLDALAEGADRVAHGHYDHPVHMPPAGRELESVAETFNAMAAQVAETEATRRRMLTDLSHEMRTPVASIDVTLEAVEDGVRPWDSTTVSVLREQTRRLARLAEDIRHVSAAEEGRLDLRPEHVPAVDLLRAATSAAQASYDAAGVTLGLDVKDAGATGPTVEADRARLGQVFDNLLRNARQHTPPGGRVDVVLRSEPERVVVTVADDGSGIAGEDLPHVFERFYRADSGRRHDEAGGTGVGLAIARAVVNAHGGTLEAASDGPGSGATFTVMLPRTG